MKTILLVLVLATAFQEPSASASQVEPHPNTESAFQRVEGLNLQPRELGLALARTAPPVARRDLEMIPFRQADGPLYYRNGLMQTTADVKAIFWGKSWIGGAGDKISGIDLWFTGVNRSSYESLSNEFIAPNTRGITDTVTYRGHIVDPREPPGDGVTAQQVLAEVCHQVEQGRLTPDPSGNGFYPVYVDTSRTTVPYCAWHSYGTCTVADQKVRVQFALVLSVDSDPDCQVGEDATGHSPGLAGIANLTAAELSSTRTDSTGLGWQDIHDLEQGIKCLWSFPPNYVILTNASQWKLQGQWSNRAFWNDTGFPNGDGQPGCVSSP